MNALLLFAGAAEPTGAETALGAHAEELVLRLLYQILVVLGATRIVSRAVRRLGQTDVSGEILAGLLLGPSLLGALAARFDPDFMTRLFHPSTSTAFTTLAQVGLILLMFEIGLEFEFNAQLSGHGKPIVAISLTGLILPFLMGYFTAPWFHANLAETLKPPLPGFRLFFAVAMSITAIPILGRIFMELGLSRTRTAALSIGAAAIGDVSGWFVLGAISILVREQPLGSWALPRLAGLALYLTIVLLVVRPVLRRSVASHLERHGSLRVSAIPPLLMLLFLSAAITSNLGVFAIIGGFVIGVTLHQDRRFVEAWKIRVSPIVHVLLLPIFFTYTGLRTDIGTIPGSSGLWILALVCGVAFASKFGGVYLAARLTGESSRSASTIGVCMNTRGLMELIVLNIGLDLGVLTPSMFTMLVIMALVSTFMATPLIRRLMRGQEQGEDEAMASTALPAASERG
jgi:Kef-type K+ transport system membrane component KefB